MLTLSDGDKVAVIDNEEEFSSKLELLLIEDDADRLRVLDGDNDTDWLRVLVIDGDNDILID
jgi:hypothetical protein